MISVYIPNHIDPCQHVHEGQYIELHNNISGEGATKSNFNYDFNIYMAMTQLV